MGHSIHILQGEFSTIFPFEEPSKAAKTRYEILQPVYITVMTSACCSKHYPLVGMKGIPLCMSDLFTAFTVSQEDTTHEYNQVSLLLGSKKKSCLLFSLVSVGFNRVFCRKSPIFKRMNGQFKPGKMLNPAGHITNKARKLLTFLL